MEQCMVVIATTTRPVRRDRSDVPRYRRAQRQDGGGWCQDVRWRLPRPARANALRVRPAGKVLITDRPYLETKEHVGCFWCWKPLTRTRRWPGGARPQLPVGHRLRHASFN
jgi:hypothetical protein